MGKFEDIFVYWILVGIFFSVPAYFVYAVLIFFVDEGLSHIISVIIGIVFVIFFIMREKKIKKKLKIN